MTGYAVAESSNGDEQVFVEIKGYNSRYLDINLNISPELCFLENKLRADTASCCGRGKVEITIKRTSLVHLPHIAVNSQVITDYLNAAAEVAEILTTRGAARHGIKISNALSFESVLQYEGVIVRETASPNQSSLRALVLPVLDRALREFDEERKREGAYTKKSLLGFWDILVENKNIIEQKIPEIEASLRETMRSRFAELSHHMGYRMDENRLLSEIALLMMKYSIAEELSRLSAHFAAFRADLDKDTDSEPRIKRDDDELPRWIHGSQGKKLDFLCQEMNREINTIGSKTPMIEVSRAVVELKDATENIREQLRNIE
jgi:uncharacterized protein (TIGR00255 family)